MALAADIAYNQKMFWGNRDYWFQPLCEQVDWDIKDHFKERFRIVFSVVCCDLNLVQDSTNHLKKTWSNSAVRTKVVKAFRDVVKTAKEQKKVKFPSTLKLFETPFPKVLA